MNEERETLDPSAAFSLVASETRFDILQSLWESTNGADRESVSFGTLRDATGMRDSGQFNYHLDQLTPQFVRKVADGYQLTSAGRRVVGAAVSGVYTDLEASMEPRAVGDCPDCHGDLVAEFAEGVMRVSCHECDTQFAEMSAPPVLVATHDPDELPAVLSRHLLTGIQQLHRGFCLHCNGPLESTVHPREGATFSGTWNVEFTCRACGHVSWSVVTGAVIDHPVVASHLHDAGYDVRTTPLWEVDPLVDATETLVSEDPIRFETSIATNDAVLELTVGEDLDVVEYDRREPAAE